MTPTTRWLALPLAALTLAACGSSDTRPGASTATSPGGSTATSPGSPSRQGASGSPAAGSEADLVAAADGICRDVGTRVAALAKPKTLPDIQRFGNQAADASQQGVVKLEELTPPDSIKSEYEAFVTIANRVTGEARKAVDATTTRDAGKIRQALSSLAAQGAQTRRLAKKIGFKVCGVSALAGLSAGPSAGSAAPTAP